MHLHVCVYINAYVNLYCKNFFHVDPYMLAFIAIHARMYVYLFAVLHNCMYVCLCV